MNSFSMLLCLSRFTVGLAIGSVKVSIKRMEANQMLSLTDVLALHGFKQDSTKSLWIVVGSMMGQNTVVSCCQFRLFIT